jgi:site-specific recombinase XerD
VSPQSVTNYSQAVREFLDFLGEHGAARKLETISEVDVQGFLESVRKSGRSATTVNEMRTYLAGAFG